MFSEENVINTLIIFGGAGGFTGMVIGCYLIADKPERELATRRKEAQHGANNYARMKAQLVTSSEVIKRG